MADQRATQARYIAEQQSIIEAARDKARIARELAEQLCRTDEALSSITRAEQRAVWRAKSAAKDARRDEFRRLKREANELTTTTAAARAASTATVPSPPNAPSPPSAPTCERRELRTEDECGEAEAMSRVPVYADSTFGSTLKGILEAGTRFAFVKVAHEAAHIGGKVHPSQYYKLADGTGWAINNDVGGFSVRVISSALTRASSTPQPPVCLGFEPNGTSVVEPGEEGAAELKSGVAEATDDLCVRADPSPAGKYVCSINCGEYFDFTKVWDTPGHKYFQLLDGRGWAEDSVRVVYYQRIGTSAPNRISTTSQPPVCSGLEPSGASVAEPGEEDDATPWERVFGPKPRICDLVWN